MNHTMLLFSLQATRNEKREEPNYDPNLRFLGHLIRGK
jgi:hypothetical protein